MQPMLDEAEHAVALFSVVFALVFPDQGRRPVKLLGKVQGEAALCNISTFLLGILVQSISVYTYIQKASPLQSETVFLCGLA